MKVTAVAFFTIIAVFIISATFALVGGFVTMHLAALLAEYFGVLAPVGFWPAVAIFVVTSTFFMLVIPGLTGNTS